MKQLRNIIVLGSNGQLGKEFFSNNEFNLQFNVQYFDKSSLDITDDNALVSTLNEINPCAVINCAAYTKVDNAENEKDLAIEINSDAVKYLAELSKKKDFVLIHFSTDYVFNGKSIKPINEKEDKDPVNFYGMTKHLGEKNIIESSEKFLIFRVSWVYSHFGKNFPKTIIKLSKEKDSLKIVDDQVGVPTPTSVIVDTVIKVLTSDELSNKFGIYNISPSGQTTWFEIASLIHENFKENKKNKLNLITPVSSKDFKTDAKRPSYSVLDNNKVQDSFEIIFKDWKEYFLDYLDEVRY